MSDDARQLIQYVPWEDLFPELGGGPTCRLDIMG
jgi:hypothetical protein